MHNGVPQGLLRVESIEHLRQLSRIKPIEGFILLNFGLRSYKTVSSKGRRFRVENHIDNTRQLLNTHELYTFSNLGWAIDRGVFYVEVPYLG
jgi:hypothetical protein